MLEQVVASVPTGLDELCAVARLNIAVLDAGEHGDWDLAMAGLRELVGAPGAHAVQPALVGEARGRRDAQERGHRAHPNRRCWQRHIVAVATLRPLGGGQNFGGAGTRAPGSVPRTARPFPLWSACVSALLTCLGQLCHMGRGGPIFEAKHRTIYWPTRGQDVRSCGG